jgi:hypothetical protein
MLYPVVTFYPLLAFRIAKFEMSGEWTPFSNFHSETKAPRTLVILPKKIDTNLQKNRLRISVQFFSFQPQVIKKHTLEGFEPGEPVFVITTHLPLDIYPMRGFSNYVETFFKAKL